MLQLQKNTSNIIYPTFSELMNDTDNWVLMELTNESNPELVRQVVLKTNLSLISRVDKYTIIETDEPNPANPEVDLPRLGFWLYEAFEISPTAPTIKIKSIESGRLNCIGEETATHSVYQ
jgi:hypothetical protein